MKHWKRWTLVLALVLSLTACGQSDTPQTTDPQTAPPQTEDVETPEAPPQATGKLYAGFLEEMDPASDPEIHREVVDASGSEVILYTDGVLRNLRVEHGSMDGDGVRFTSDRTIFTAETFTKDQLLVLKTEFGDVNPTLRVHFDGADGQEDVFLFQSGKDGSILLLPAAEFLVEAS